MNISFGVKYTNLISTKQIMFSYVIMDFHENIKIWHKKTLKRILRNFC